jgi:hypothetical protein
MRMLMPLIVIVAGTVASTGAVVSNAEPASTDGSTSEQAGRKRTAPAEAGPITFTLQGNDYVATSAMPTAKARAIVRLVKEHGPGGIRVSATDVGDGRSILRAQGAGHQVRAVMFIVLFLDGGVRPGAEIDEAMQEAMSALCESHLKPTPDSSQTPRASTKGAAASDKH